MKITQKKRSVSPRLTPQAETYLNSWTTKNSLAEYTIEMWVHLYRRALASALEKLSDSEQSLVTDALLSTRLTPGLAGEQILADIEDSITLDNYDKKWQVDGKKIVERIKNMSQLEKIALEIWAKREL